MGQFSDLTDEAQGASPASAPLVVRIGADTSPDRAAQALQLARRYQLPAGVAETFAEDYKARALTEDSRAIFERSPRLGSWVSQHHVRAAAAQDDLETLGGIETTIRTLKNIPAAIAKGFPSAGAGLWGAAAAPFEVIGQGMTAAENAARDLIGLPRFDGPQPGTVIGEFLRNEQRAAEGVAQRIGPQVGPGTGVVERGVYSGFQSATQTLITLPIALRQGGENIALGIMGATQGGESYGKAREKLDPARAAVFGTVQGVAEAAFERAPMLQFIKDVKAGSALGTLLVNNLKNEVPGEIATTLVQNFNEWVALNPDKSFGQWIDEQPEAIAETIVATMVGAGAQTGAVKGIQAVAERFGGEDRRAQQGEQAAATAEALAKLAEASKLRGRDAESFREFVQQVADEEGDTPTEFYVDGAQLANVLNQSGVTMQELEAVAPVVASQLEAAMTGGDVRVPVSEFLTAGEALTAPLIDHLRMTPDGMSRAEAQDYMKEQGDRIQREVEAELQRVDDQAQFRQSIEAVRAEFEAELGKAKRFTADVNRAYADLLANFYGATAARLGMTPQELLAKYRLRVQSKLADGQRVMEQGAVDDATGLPLNDDGTVTVYHHTTAEKAAEIRRTGMLKSAGEPDLYFTTTAETTTGYGDTAVPFRVKPERLQLDDEFPDGRHDYRVAAPAKARRVKFRPDGEGVLYQGETPRAQISLPASFDAGPAVISLLENADLSSFLHESGHLFLEIQADLAIKIQQQISAGASVTAGERQIVEDMNRLLEWFGVKGDENLPPLQAWAMMSLEEKRASHEQFARGFEAYAFEGKAPSLELQSVFQRFRSWLLQVYQTLRSLKVELNDDVRAVMGRMLASDFAIEEAEAARNMGPLFKDAESAGMTLDEFNAYQGLARGATEDAIAQLQARGLKDMRWLSRARDKALKARQQEVEELRREVRQEVRSEVLQEPVYRAWQFLTGRVLDADKVDAPAVRKSVPGPVDNTVDSMFIAIAKMGGMRRDAAAAGLGIDPKQRSPMPLFGTPLLLRDGGLTQDAMAERLGEQGYLTLDENGKVDIAEFQERFQAELRGIKQYSYAKDYADAQGLAADAGLNIDGAERGKLDLGALIERYGPADAKIAKLKALRMTAKAGWDFDAVGENFGFDSGDALVTALTEAAPLAETIEARTDQRMLEMFGDITSPDALQRAADEAVHNEARARVIAAELKALQDANSIREDTGKRTKKGRKVTVDVMARAAKDYAQQIIGRLKVREIRPAQYAAAEARNAKLAEKALASGKTDEAAMHKRNQLVKNHATKAAYEAQAEVKQIQAYFRRFEKRPKSVDPGYLDQIDGLLERFDFRNASLKEIDRRKSFKAWYDEQVADGNVPTISDELLDEANRKSFKDMTLEELRGLRDAVKNIEHLGKLKNRLLTARDQRTFDAVADEMAASIRDNGGKERPVQLEGEKGFRYWLEGIAAMHRKLSSLFRQMDGGNDSGPMYEHIVRGMNERGAWEDTRIEQATVALSKLYAPLLKMRGGITGHRSKVFIPEIKASLTRGGRLAVALNWGNADNRQRVLDGDKWTDGQVRAILGTLTAEELAFVNGVWEFIDSYWPEIAAKEKRLTGVEPEKVKAEPFTVQSADGVTVQMRGGYYPLKYDTDRSDRADSQEAAQVAKEMMRGAMTRATTRRGHTKERVKEVKRAVRKDLSVITQHVKQVNHDLAWHEWLIDTNRLLRDDRVVDAIRSHYGPKVLKTIRDDVAGIATADVLPMTDVDKALMTLRGNVSRATMGASLTTAFLQPFGLTQSMARIGSAHVARGMARWAGDAAKLENSLAWIREKSEFMRLRSKTFNRELREVSSAVEGKTAAMRAIDGGLFWLMQKMQLVADVPTWIGQYEKTLAQYPAIDEADEAAVARREAEAVAQADSAVIEAQGSGQPKDLSEIQRKYPLLTQFYSYFSVTANLIAEKTVTTDFKNPRAVAGWLGDMALLAVIPAILPALLMHLLRGGGDDDEPEEWAKRIAQWQVGYLLGAVVGLREFSGAVQGFDYTGPPVGRIVGDITKAGKQTAQGEVDEPMVLAYINVLGTALGIPVVQLTRSYKGWKAWDEGDAGPQAVLFGPPPKP